MRSITYAGTRRFRLQRHRDITGVSGEGLVANGVVFFGGVCIVHWRGPFVSTTVHQGIESVETVHCHDGLTSIVWDDPVCFRCLALLTIDEQTASHCFGCGAGQGESLYYGTRAEDPTREE